MKSIYYIVGGVVVVLALMAGWQYYEANRPGPLDDFAACLTEQGATFYGAFWCPHCQDQKAIFGSSMKNINYIECSTPDGRSQLSVCNDAEVTNYPTWDFADAPRETGVLQPARLAEITGCELPADR